MKLPHTDSQKVYEYCPVCESGVEYWRPKVGDGVTYRIYRCEQCGYAFINPRPSQAWLANWYNKSGHHTSEYKLTDQVTLNSVLEREEKDPNSIIDAKRMIKTIRELSRKKMQLSLLDVGCGYGFFSKEALDQGFSVTPLELASNERGIASEILGIEPIASSFEDFCSSTNGERFDVVLMSQILEHACDINLWVEKAHELLNESGIIAVALPNFNSYLRYILKEREPYITPPAHLNYFSPKSLGKLLEKHGFKVEAVQHVSRIPRTTFEKRLTGKVSGLIQITAEMSRIVLGSIDQVRLGMIINVYARKL